MNNMDTKGHPTDVEPSPEVFALIDNKHSLSALSDWLQRTPEPLIDGKGNDYYSPLMYAIEKDNYPAFKLFLESGRCNPHWVNTHMCHAVWQAAMSQNPRFLRDLYTHPGFVEQVNDRCIHNQLPVFVALARGHIINVIRLLSDDRVNKDDLADGSWLVGFEAQRRFDTARIYRDVSPPRGMIMLLAGMGPRIWEHYEELSVPHPKHDDGKFNEVQIKNLADLKRFMENRTKHSEIIDQTTKQGLKDVLKSIDQDLEDKWSKVKISKIMEHVISFLDKAILSSFSTQ